MAVSWAEFEDAAPDMANAVRARFEANRHHVVGTLRGSGAPRLSGTEVEIGHELRIGVMADTHKLADLRRDGRAELHSAPLEEDLALGDTRVSGVLIEDGVVGDSDGFYFRMEIERVTLVQVSGSQLWITTWTPKTGTTLTRRD